MKRDSVLLRWLWHRTAKRIPALILLLVTNIATALLGVAFAVASKNIVNQAVSGTREGLFQAATVQLALVCGVVICLTLQRYVHSKTAAELDRDWKRNLARRILHGEYLKVTGFHSGELINRMNNDVRAVDEGILSVFPGFLSMLTRVISVGIVLFLLEPFLTSFLLLLGLIVALIAVFARKFLNDLNKKVSTADGKVSGFFQEIFEKLLVVQAMNLEKEVLRRGDVLMEERFRLQKRRWTITLTSNTFISLVGYFTAFVALIYSALALQKGVMDFGELTVMTQLVGQFYAPMVHLSGILPKYILLLSACERLYELEQLCESYEKQEGAESVSYEEVLAICAEDLSFAYDKEKVLQNATFSLPRDSFAVVTGASGIGKSTLLKLLLGIFPQDSGSLYVATENACVPLSAATRELFAYVPQGNLLFSGTVRENLILAKQNASEEELETAIYVSALDSVIDILPQGLDTVLGENGHGLSDGQAQRLSIARAVLADAPILLLDECTSSLDEETERTVLERLRALPHKTCIVVTHRPAALEFAQWQLQVDDGWITCQKI